MHLWRGNNTPWPVSVIRPSFIKRCTPFLKSTREAGVRPRAFKIIQYPNGQIGSRSLIFLFPRLFERFQIFCFINTGKTDIVGFIVYENIAPRNSGAD